MPDLLTIEGFGTVPVQAHEPLPVDHGSREPASDATPLSSLRGRTVRHAFTTAEMPAAEADALASFLRGRGDQWALASAAIWSDLGQAPSASASTSHRPLEGKFSAGATAVEQATTNLLTSTEQTFVGWSTSSGATYTPTQGHAFPGGVTSAGATRIVSAGGTSTLKVFILKAAVPVGSFGGASIYLYNQGTAAVTVSVTNLTGAATRVFQPGEYGRYAAVGSGTGNSRQLRISTASADQSLDVVVYRPQVDSTPLLGASFTAGTRTAGALTIPALCTATEGTVSTWWTPEQVAASIVDQASSPAILTYNGYMARESWRLSASAFAGAEPTLTLSVRGATSATWSAVATAKASGSGWYTLGSPMHVAVTWTKGSEFSVYWNGALATTATIADRFSATTGSAPLSVGTADTSATGNGTYHRLHTGPTAWSSSQPASEYAQALVPATWPEVRCSGTAFGSQSPICRAQVTRVRTVEGMGDYRVVEFTLQERVPE